MEQKVIEKFSKNSGNDTFGDRIKGIYPTICWINVLATFI